MRRDDPLKLLSEVRDLQIVDRDGRNCGICDDVELDGGSGEPLKVAALLVGPGAYGHRLPDWVSRSIRKFAGQRITRVPWSAIDKISGRIYLSVTAEALGLRKTEDRLQTLFKRIPLS
jgi:sporulation protein YlmC with PRC-barrel domain